MVVDFSQKGLLEIGSKGIVFQFFLRSLFAFFSKFKGMMAILVLISTSSSSPAQPSVHQRPQLVVGIMVDGLQHQHLQQLWTRFNGDGFKKLTSAGASFRNMKSPTTSFGNAADITTLFTGTVPYYHGITGDRAVNPSTSDVISIFNDRNQSGIQSHLQLSARAMEASTWVDELMMAGRTRSKSYVVGIHPDDAIAMGGHAASGVVWLDEVRLRWGSTDYYSGGMPWQAAQMNSSEIVKQRAGAKWQTLFFPRTYLAALSDPAVKDFSYTASDKQKGSTSASILKTTPIANSLVAELALKLLKEQELGKDLHPDALLLQFTVRTPSEQSFSVASVEKEDMYLRLDNELQELIQQTEKAIGAEKVLFVLFGTQSDTHSPEELKRFNFNTGYYNSYRSMALLNSYLMALYGQEKWVRAYYGRHIYLDRRLIEEKGLDFRNFQQVVAEFVSEFEGVQTAWPFYQLIQMPVNPAAEMGRHRNSVHRKTAGDVVIMLKPGWLEADDQNRPVGESGSLNSFFPVYISGWKVLPQSIREVYSVTDIASTLTGLLQLSAPNASIGNEIPLKLKE